MVSARIFFVVVFEGKKIKPKSRNFVSSLFFLFSTEDGTGAEGRNAAPRMTIAPQKRRPGVRDGTDRAPV